jgi:hypothetical protein
MGGRGDRPVNLEGMATGYTPTAPLRPRTGEADDASTGA